eukprot:7202643-Pyramimonas_sp.AAC.1
MESSQLGLLPDLESQNYSYCSSQLERCCRVSVFNSGCSAGSHRDRFQDIRRVRLSNPELGTRSAART